MRVNTYKKIAGTSAVFISTEYEQASPVERDGLVWSEAELCVNHLPEDKKKKPSMSTVLALEGLEDYDKPSDGDVRHVESMGINFIYIEKKQSWVQATDL